MNDNDLELRLSVETAGKGHRWPSRVGRVLLPAVILLMVCAQVCLADVIRLGKPNDPEADISSRVLVEAYRRLDITVQFLTLPAQRSLHESNRGRLDGEVNRIWGIEKTYTNLIRIPVPVNAIEAMAFSKTRRFTVNGWESLKPYSIAIRIGTKYAEQGTAGFDIAKFPSYEQIFMLLAKARYDIGIASRTSGMVEIKTQKLTGIVALEPPILVTSLYHYLHRKHERIVPRITRTLQAMEKEGRIQQIRDDYLDRLFSPD